MRHTQEQRCNRQEKSAQTERTAWRGASSQSVDRPATQKRRLYEGALPNVPNIYTFTWPTDLVWCAVSITSVRQRCVYTLDRVWRTVEPPPEGGQWNCRANLHWPISGTLTCAGHIITAISHIPACNLRRTWTKRSIFACISNAYDAYTFHGISQCQHNIYTRDIYLLPISASIAQYNNSKTRPSQP